MDVVSKILSILQNQWSINNPSSSDISFKLDEFDPKDPLFQIVVENYPITSTWVIQGVYRIEHRVRINIYCKPKRYDLDTIANTRILWYNMKKEVDRILQVNKFNVESVVNLDLSGGWDDEDTIAVGRGVKKGWLKKKFPIIWYSNQIVICIYYSNKELISE